MLCVYSNYLVYMYFCIAFVFLYYFIYIYLIYNVLYWVDRGPTTCHINNGATCLVMEPVTHLPPLNMFCRLVTQRFEGIQVTAWTVSDNKHDFKYTCTFQ